MALGTSDVFKRSEPVFDHPPEEAPGGIPEPFSRNRAEESLRQSEQRYRQLLGAVTSYTYSVELDGGAAVSAQHSPGCLSATGYSPDEFERDPDLWIFMVHPEDREMVRQHAAKVMAGEDVPPIEHRIFHKDETVRWVRDTVVRHCDDRGQLVRYDGLVEEITKRKQAEEALVRAKEEWERTFDAVPDLIAVLDARHRIVKVNKAMAARLGVSTEACVGQTCYRAIHGTDEPPPFCPHSQLLADGHEHTAEIHEPLLNGDFLVTTSPLWDSEGRLTGGVHVARDVTDRKRSEEALRKKDEQLRQSQKMEAVGGLAGGIAHEFNNLLQAIGGYTKYAMEGLSPEEQRHQDLEQVVKAIDRATTLTRQLLSFGRRQVLERRNVDPNEVVAELIEMVRPVIGEHILLELQIADNVGTVYADPGELQQVLLNLCLNARDAMPSGGELVLRTESTVVDRGACKRHPGTSPGRHVVLSVTDTGCGIPPELKKRIFEPFFTTKRIGEGTGLGLATVYGIVEQHGGTIRVHSEVGEGTTFKVYLPAVDAIAAADRVSQDECTQGGTETILMAEDEPMVRDIAVRILESAGYTVLVASDGGEALRLFEENREAISVVLLDAIMPKLNGHEVYRQIIEKSPEMKVIFCSGYDFETSRSDFISSESLRLVEKPFGPDALLRTLREVLDQEEPCPAVQANG